MEKSKKNKLIAYTTALFVMLGGVGAVKVVHTNNYNKCSNLEFENNDEYKRAIILADMRLFNVLADQESSYSYSQKFLYLPDESIKDTINDFNVDLDEYNFNFQKADSLDEYSDEISLYELDKMVYNEGLLVIVTSKNIVDFKLGKIADGIDNWDRLNNLYDNLDKKANLNGYYGQWYAISEIVTNPDLFVSKDNQKTLAY